MEQEIKIPKERKRTIWTKEKLEERHLTDHLVKERTGRKAYERETRWDGVSVQIRDGIPVLHFSCFRDQDWMEMAFSTRLGGISTGYCGELNLGWERGEDREIVAENYRLICRSLGVPPENLVLSDQIHETKVEYVTQRHTAGESVVKRLSGIDGMVTDIPELVLATSYADCVPLFFADPVHHAIASSHSGWRGTTGMMGRQTVEKMKECFQSRPEELICLIGPSICQDCYEISEEVAEHFHKEYSGEALKDILSPGKEGGKYQLDLWSANYHQLKKAGVRPENIQVSGVCTCCHKDLLYSHRATSGKRGNLNGFIWKKN